MGDNRYIEAIIESKKIYHHCEKKIIVTMHITLGMKLYKQYIYIYIYIWERERERERERGVVNCKSDRNKF